MKQFFLKHLRVHNYACKKARKLFERIFPLFKNTGNLFKNTNLQLKNQENEPFEYAQTISTILESCNKIKTVKWEKGNGHDGRISSAIAEKPFLDLLEKSLERSSFKIERPRDRYWYDIRINGIPINLKITTGNTDNAINKVAVIYTLTGIEVKNKNMNFNTFYRILWNSKIKTERNRQTEYHYLVINKTNGSVLLKSILDIHTYKTNPSNVLQINWKNEFGFIDYRSDNNSKKMYDLLKCIQVSVRESINSNRQFAEADLEVLIEMDN